MPAAEVIAKYHDLWHVEKSFRMSKTDLAAPPMFHRTHDAIEAPQDRTDSTPYLTSPATRWIFPCSVPNSVHNVRTIRTTAAFSFAR